MLQLSRNCLSLRSDIQVSLSWHNARSSEPCRERLLQDRSERISFRLIEPREFRTVISGHNTAVARFAHRLTLQLVEPAFYRKRSRTLSPFRLLLFGKTEQFPHQLNLR